MSADDPLDLLTRSMSEGEPVDWHLLDAPHDLDEDTLRALKDIERIADFSRRLQRVDAMDETAVQPSPTESGRPPERWGDLMLLERIGAGAQGEVWRAWDASLQRQVALKFLLTADFKSERAPSSNLVSEARTLARIRHPGVVSVHGVATHDQRTGMWMEWVEGITLAREIERRGALPAREVARIGLELCTALEALESAGVVHRDVKPANVVVETGGRVVLTDFGLGWRPALDEAGTRRSGTPIFMAPELLSGGEPGPGSDLYALGVTLWWALAGRSPFRSKTIAELREEAARGPSDPLRTVCPGAPEALVDAIEWAMKPEAAERPQSAAALAARLKVAVHDAPAATPAAKSAAGTWWKLGLAALAVAGLAVWIVAGLHTAGDERASAWTPRRLAVPPQVARDDCSISPDGTKIAYVSDSSAALSIFSIDGGDTRTVDRLAPGEGSYFNVGWSADGAKLVASRCDALGNATVAEVDLITGRRDVVARLGTLGPGQTEDMKASLSPRGDLLAIRREYRPAMGKFLELGVVDVRAGTERVLIHGSNEFIGPPAWAPDGSRLAYVLARGRAYSRLETCDLRGSRTTVAVDSADGLEPFGYDHPSLLWLSARRLLYALRPSRHGEHRDAEWWSVRVDPATGRASGQARQEYALPGAAVHSPSASKTGQVAFTAERVLREVRLVGADGKARYPNLTSGAQLANLHNPIWSNDGRRLLVGSTENPSRISIGWVGLVDGRFEPVANAMSVSDQPLCFTASGQEFLRGDGSRLVATRVADGATRVVADPFPGIVLRAGRSDAWLAVEHLGSDIVARDFSPATGPGAIRFRYPAKGLEEGFAPTADLSSDGKRLVVLRSDAPGYDVLDALSGRTLRRIDLPAKSYPQSVRWSADGSTLYATGIDGVAKFWIARLGAHGIDRLIWRSEAVWPGDLSISPDGTTLAFASLDFAHELWVMERH